MAVSRGEAQLLGDRQGTTSTGEGEMFVSRMWKILYSDPSQREVRENEQMWNASKEETIREIITEEEHDEDCHCDDCEYLSHISKHPSPNILIHRCSWGRGCSYASYV